MAVVQFAAGTFYEHRPGTVGKMFPEQREPDLQADACQFIRRPVRLSWLGANGTSTMECAFYRFTRATHGIAAISKL
jgi:hypothetical protein